MDGVVLRRNRIHDNRRFGIFFYDGANGATAGKGAIRSEYDLVWGNGVGVQVGRASTNKTIKHLTADDNVSDGVRIGEGGHPAAGASVIDSLCRRLFDRAPQRVLQRFAQAALSTSIRSVAQHESLG